MSARERSRSVPWLVVVCFVAGCTLETMGTGAAPLEHGAGGSGGMPDASADGAAGTIEFGGKAGQAGVGGSAGQGGAAGAAAVGGFAGAGGALGGAAGVAGASGTGGIAGAAGGGGTAGIAGAAGAGGVAGSAGASGAGGAAGSAGTAGAAGAGGGTVQAWRAPITIAASTSSLPADFTIRVDISHLSLVAQNKSTASGNDVRVLRWDGSQWSEVDRVADPVTSWNSSVVRTYFRLQAAQPVSTQNQSFWVYYGPAIQGLPKADGKQVYLLWDSFDGNTLGAEWTVAQIGNATATATVANGRVRLQSSGGDLWDNADNFAFLFQPLSGSFTIDASVAAYGGNLGGWAKMGGVMLRQSVAAGSRNRVMSPVNGSAARTNSFRLADNGPTDEVAINGANPIPEFERLARTGNQSRAWYSNDGLTFVEDGTGITFSAALVDPVLVGIPLAPLNGANQGWVEIDWFRARRAVANGPTNSIGLEQATTYPPVGAP